MLMPVRVLALVLKERQEEERETQVPCSQPHAQARQSNSVNPTEKVVAVTGLQDNPVRDMSIPKAQFPDIKPCSFTELNAPRAHRQTHPCPIISYPFPTSLLLPSPRLHVRNVFLAIWKRNGKKGDAKHRNKLSLISAVEGFGPSMMGEKKKTFRVINPYIPTPNYTRRPEGHGIMVNKYRCSSY